MLAYYDALIMVHDWQHFLTAIEKSYKTVESKGI